jgi:hypothetical protein
VVGFGPGEPVSPGNLVAGQACSLLSFPRLHARRVAHPAPHATAGRRDPAIEDQLRRTAARAFTVGGFDDHENDPKNPQPPPTVFHTADELAKTRQFPTHYTLYVLHEKYNGGGGGPSWNHGETSGAAVSSTAGEVVYWAESW